MVSRRNFGKLLGGIVAFCAVPITFVRAAVSTKETWLPKPVYYATVGETVTCTNGHPICDFVESVTLGQTEDPEKQLGNWRQPAPKVGELPIPGCAICGARFYVGLGLYHIGDSWRDPLELLNKYPVLKEIHS